MFIFANASAIATATSIAIGTDIVVNIATFIVMTSVNDFATVTVAVAFVVAIVVVVGAADVDADCAYGNNNIFCNIIVTDAAVAHQSNL